MGKNGAVIHYLAGAVDYRHLDPGTQAGIEPQRWPRTCRSEQEQIFQVGSKNVDGFGFSRFTHLGDQIGFNLCRQLHAPGPAHHIRQPFVGGPAVIPDAPVGGNSLLGGMGLTAILLSIAHNNRIGQNALIAAPKNGQRPVRRNLSQRFNVVEVIPELGAFVFLAFHHSDFQLAFLPDEIAQGAKQLGIFGKTLHQNVAGTVQSGFDILNAGFRIEVTGSDGFRILGGIVVEGIGQRLQTCFPGNLRLGAALGLVGQVKIFQAVLGVGSFDGGPQLVGQLALFLNAVEDGAPAVFQLTQVAQPLFQGPQLAIVQGTRYFFSVASNKGNGSAFIKKGNGGINLLFTYAELFGNAPGNTVHAASIWYRIRN